MSVRFICGPSGSGKSTFICNEIINESKKDPARKYLLIVPDQFTMQTQVRMIELHPDHAFLNIEVLSFSRLAHRILEEVGGEDIPVLDDTGKCLIIRQVAGRIKDSLDFMADRIDRYSFISEVKSALSEFMQYGLSPEDVSKLADSVSEKSVLSRKLKDLEVIYRAFLEYKSNDFITKEETLDIVTSSLHNSELVRDSEIFFDGFTGFTPIQEKVITELLCYASRVWFSFTMPAGSDIYAQRNKEDMFYLPGTAITRILKLAEGVNVIEEDPVILKASVKDRPMLSHLEANVFRYPMKPYSGEDTGSVRIFKAANTEEEIRDTFLRIKQLIEQNGYRYRDIAIVTGDLSSYADEMIHIARELEIPIYMDYSESIMQTAFIESICSAYDVIRSDYQAESVIRHLRTGFGPLNEDETDELENFLIKRGIRGRSSYEHVWTVSRDKDEDTPEKKEENIRQFNRINDLRERIVSHFSSLHNNDISYARALYSFLENSAAYDRQKALSDKIAEEFPSYKRKADVRIYDKVIGLLDQIESLIGDDIKDPDEFYGILEAGLMELKLGVIPQEKDMILVGDMIRTRLSYVKVLFLLGANDCNIPGRISSGGLISDIDREYLNLKEGVTLAPTPREQMFSQRLYLYMNMTKPADRLYISYVLTDLQGKDMQPSYLIGTLCKLFPGLEAKYSGTSHMAGDMLMPSDKANLKTRCAALMRAYISGAASEEEIKLLGAMCRILAESDMSDIYLQICEAVNAHYDPELLSKDIAHKLYGEVIKASVSRLEQFAKCAYAHFLSYGLNIRPRSEYGFEKTDMGEVYHSALEEFSVKMRNEGLEWAGLDEEEASKWVDEIMERIEISYSDSILISNGRNKALSKRIRRVIKRSVDTIRFQITSGEFVPAYFEKAFLSERHVKKDGGNISYSLQGRIDRVDKCSNENNEYLRVIDYKSGNRQFSLEGLYYGLMLQLSVYLGEAVKKDRTSLPAGLLYYHIGDPLINGDDTMNDDAVKAGIQMNLRMSGAVSDDEKVLLLMDKNLVPKEGSKVIPVKLNKDGVPDRYSHVYPPDVMELIYKYAFHKSDELVLKMMDGEIGCKPVGMDKKKLPCIFCDYAPVCKIYSGIDGYKYECCEKMTDEDLIREMKNETE